MSASLNLKNKTNFDAMCRICLKSDAPLNYLFKTEAPDMLKYCGFLEVEEFDEFPDKICALCSSTLTLSYNLKQQCISSKVYLLSILEAEANVKANSLPSRIESESECHNKLINGTKSGDSMYECSGCVDPNNISDGYCNKIVNDANKDFSYINDNCDIDCDKDKICEIFDTTPNNSNEIPEVIEENDIYSCPKCEQTFEHKQDVSVHQSIHGENLTCNACQKVYGTMGALKRHLKRHMLSKSHTCKICDKGFAESADVAKHARRHHLGIPREKNHECKVCGQRFTDQYYLRVHQRKHTGEKPLSCDICEKSFYDPRSLRVHLDGHKGIKRYLCNYCGKSFLQNAHLRQHIIVHSKEKPYSCPTCNKCFTQSTSLQRHQKAHRRRQERDLCPQGLSRQQQLYRHKEKHGKQEKSNTSKDVEF